MSSTSREAGKLYKLSGKGGVACMIPTKEIIVEEEGKVRKLRYCKSVNSIYEEEQGDAAVHTPIVFREGQLLVGTHQPNLINFLSKHPGNRSNGGSLFYEVNKRKEAEDSLSYDLEVNDAITRIRKLEHVELIPIANFYGLDTESSKEELQFALVTQAKKNPSKFIEAFDSPDVETRSLLIMAEKMQLIRVQDGDRGGVWWFDNDQIIVNGIPGRKSIDILTDYCMTTQGQPTLEKIREELD
ncbi:MAG: hypothetical protein HRT61_00400 [Ekhidna sp.]|nr:hypothetical protein [Ekhidna sp.]